MNMLTLAQAGGFFGGHSIGDIAIFVIFVVVVIGIVLIVMKVANVQLPSWVWAIVGLIALAFLAIGGIRMLQGM